MNAALGRRPRAAAAVGPEEQAGRRSVIRAREWVALLGVITVTIGAPLAYSIVAGSFQIPHNDDWAFSRVALDFHQTGRLNLIGAGQMTLIGHVLWAQPFLSVLGPGLPALHVANAVAGAAGVVACFGIFRRLTGARPALVGAASVALLPGYGLLSIGFMTDVTAFSFEMIGIAVALAALDRRGVPRRLLLFGSGVAGVAAFSVRQTAIPALVAVACAALWQSSARRELRQALADLATFAAAGATVVLMAQWRAGLPNQDRPPTGSPAIGDLVAALAGISTLALFVTPVLWLALGSGLEGTHHWRRRALAVVLALPWVSLVCWRQDPILGNVFTRRGASDGVLPGVKPSLFPQPLWFVLQVLALAGVIGLVLLLGSVLVSAAQRRRTAAPGGGPGPLLVAFAGLALAAALAPALRGSSLFDRYLYPAAAGVMALILWRLGAAEISRKASRGALALLGLLLAATMVLDIESIRFDRARWDVGEDAVRDGVPAGRIDAGYEWTGYHATLPVPAGRPQVVSTAPSWWSRAYAGDLPCVVVMASELDDPRYTLDHVRPYGRVGDDGLLLVYRLRNPCAGGPAQP